MKNMAHGFYSGITVLPFLALLLLLLLSGV